MNKIMSRRRDLDTLDEAMGRSEDRSVNVVGVPADEDEQRYHSAMDMELLPADKVMYQAYSHNSSSSSLNSPTLISRPASSSSFNDMFSELIEDRQKPKE
jgi:hypothetical protein